MGNLKILAIISGVCFGVWPLLMNRSGLNGMMASAVFTAMVFIFVIPFAIGAGVSNLFESNWKIVVPATVLGAIGMIAFNTMLAKAEPQSVSTLFVIMVIVQTAIPVAYQIFVDGGMSVTKSFGYFFAVMAIILLFKG